MGFDLTGIGSVADLARDLVGRFFPAKMTEEQRMQAQAGIEAAISAREQVVMAARRDVTVAELHQDDNYTKRARPTVVYAGLAFIGLVHVILPCLVSAVQAFKGVTMEPPELSLPSEFWVTWGGVCSAWIIGRSVEKRGVTGKLGQLAGMITGGR